MKEVTVQQLKQMKEEGSSFQLVDVREKWEVDVCNIGGEHIPLAEIIERKDELSPDVPVIIHCRSGGRSAKLVQILHLQFGKENVLNLQGGILAWADEIDTSLEKY